MQEILESSAKLDVQSQYYLPHHCVLRESSTTTKIRVVFDASNKLTSGVSLNDALVKGAVLQEDLFSILTSFRNFRYVITSDIEKMYRQVLIDENQTLLQRIVWRNDHKLAELKKSQFPVGATITQKNFYMDDLLTGTDSIAEARKIQNQVTALLLKGGFVLQKWAPNSKELLQYLPGPQTEAALIKLDKDGTSKTLGIKWNHSKDLLQYTIGLSCPQITTKKTIMSNIAQIFDPLGLLTPVIITAKLLIQELWKLQVEWDESLPSEIFTKWTDYVEERCRI